MSPDRTAVQAATDAPPPTRHDGKLAAGDVLVIGILMVSTLTVLLNEMLLGVALPTLIVDLGITPTTGQWLTTGYLLTLAILIPATGFLMRKFHLRTIFIGSMSLFTVGTAIAAAAPGFGVLFTGRIIQAVGTAALMPLLMATTMRLVPPHRRGRVMALVTGLTAVAPAFGPAVSGLVISQLSWRWLFILVVPVALAGLALGAARLRNITTPEPVTPDVLSLVLSALAFGALVYGLSSIGESTSGHAPVPPYLPIVLGLVALAGFVRRQSVLQRSDNAFLDMRIFRTGAFTVPLLVMLVVALVGFGATMVLPLVLTNVVGLTTFEIGLFLVPGGILIALVSVLGGRVYDRYGPRPLAVPGSVIWTGSLWFLSRVDDSTGVPALLAAYLVMSASQALMWAPMTTAALSSLGAELYPHGSAAFTTAQQLAGAAGGAVLISAYTIGAHAQDAGALDLAQSVSAAQAAFTTAAAIGCLAIVGTLCVRKASADPQPPASHTSGATVNAAAPPVPSAARHIDRS
ncbi:DHA2 family efflux MFS transporter permease subunit [Streptomyces griseoloalbus]|uniref:DHA2 family lincomycin resistance protein-like MFS transporter n=1 Tax=Streptomyces griseoloalbus TaxID=67303 RepID=A0A7W8BRM2_9ACTN|nr:DHA2 family efflux MFS transporter permease subunit [Streptomyces albaduncus]MBB5128160.1 DHA2 family lincomycin resistance protein-like MFS transporter [Streptomyces albaduncus]GGW53576.1 MFS transporter [Streptomyces albaduncus]